MAAGTAMIAAQPVTSFMISFIRLDWTDRLVYMAEATDSRTDSVHLMECNTWS